MDIEMIGKTFNDFTIVEKIGEGGMGKVYLAIQNSLDREVAIKTIIGGQSFGSSEKVERFFREARITASIQHPNIVNIYEIGKHKDFFYIAMEYVDGSSLDAILQKNTLPEATAWQIALQVCHGLQAALQKNIIHRDIKPGNILVLPGNNAKLTDFGLSKRITDQEQLTMAGTIMGSPSYMSPEQATGKEATFQSDIYSLGATVYQMLTGQVLFSGNSVVEILYKHKAESPTSPQEYASSISRESSLVLAKMIAKQADDRYQSYGDLISDITGLLHGKELYFSETADAMSTYRVSDRFRETGRKKIRDSLSSGTQKIDGVDCPLFFITTRAFDLALPKCKGYKFHIIASHMELRACLRRHGFARVVVDGQHLGPIAVDFLHILRKEFPKTAVIIIVDAISEKVPKKLHQLFLPCDGKCEEEAGEILAQHLAKPEKFYSAKLDLQIILALAESQDWSARLWIDEGTPQEGLIVLQQGKIMRIQRGDLEGKKALDSLIKQNLSWQSNRSSFKSSINTSTYQMLSSSGSSLESEKKEIDLETKTILSLPPEPSELKDPCNGNSGKDSDWIGAETIDNYEELELSFEEEESGEAHEKSHTAALTKGGQIIAKERSQPSSNVSAKAGVSGKFGTIKARGRTEDTILQHLLLSMNIMDLSQFSECISVQVELRLKGHTYKSLADILVEENYIDRNYVQNLKFFRDKEGKSLIPGYEIVKVLGEGGIAIVYLGRNTKNNETAAIKVFAPGISDTSSAIARFTREAEAAKKLDHPNIVKANTFGTIHGIYYLIMEYIPGLSLSQIISKMGRLSEEKALEILEQLADALTYAWGKGIIHRDIKPGNILSDGDILKICDLGLAKALGSEIELTQEGSLIGTPQFMSPEQFQAEKEIDFRTDVYSLGVTFYIMLTGNLPFTASTKVGFAQAHMLQPPAPIQQHLNSQISKPTKALMSKMLEKDREKRCKETGEILNDIKRVRNGKYPKNYRVPGSSLKKYSAIGSLVLTAIVVAFCFMFSDAFRRKGKEEQYTGQIIVAQKDGETVKIIKISPGNGSRIYEKKVKLTGRIQASKLNYILVNDMQVAITKSSNNTWTFTTEVSLAIGRNDLRLSIVPKKGKRVGKKLSIWRIELDTEQPQITLLEPSNVEKGKKYLYTRKILTLKGYATDNEKVKSISIDKKPVPTLLKGKKMFFDYPLKLKEGVQDIIISARDERGNEGRYAFKGYLRPMGWFGEKMPKGMSKGKKRGEYIWNKDGSIMVYVPEGEFWWGRKKKARKIYMSAYYIDKYEVTWKLFLKYCKEKKKSIPKSPSWGLKEAHPIITVSYKKTKDYAKWLGKEIPTVAQWKKAARGGIDIPDWKSQEHYVPLTRNTMPFRIYSWGNEPPNAEIDGQKTYRCNYCADDSFVGQAYDGYMYTGRVGDFPKGASPYGCFDMMGNVFEMCRDRYSKDYFPATGEADPKGPVKASKFRVKMGGSFHSLAKKCTIDYREKLSENRKENQTGFRLCVKAIK